MPAAFQILMRLGKSKNRSVEPRLSRVLTFKFPLERLCFSMDIDVSDPVVLSEQAVSLLTQSEKVVKVFFVGLPIFEGTLHPSPFGYCDL